MAFRLYRRYHRLRFRYLASKQWKVCECCSSASRASIYSESQSDPHQLHCKAETSTPLPTDAPACKSPMFVSPEDGHSVRHESTWFFNLYGLFFVFARGNAVCSPVSARSKACKKAKAKTNQPKTQHDKNTKTTRSLAVKNM